MKYIPIPDIRQEQWNQRWPSSPQLASFHILPCNINHGNSDGPTQSIYLTESFKKFHHTFNNVQMPNIAVFERTAPITILSRFPPWWAGCCSSPSSPRCLPQTPNAGSHPRFLQISPTAILTMSPVVVNDMGWRRPHHLFNSQMSPKSGPVLPGGPRRERGD